MADKKMANLAAWIEIPAADLGRAKIFYQAIFDMKMEDMDFGDELKMSLFPVEQSGVGGALCAHKDFYRPGQEGPLVYLSAGPDLQKVLDKVEPNGGKIFQEKKKITDDYGYMAVFIDTEGNRIALHSMS